MRPDLHALSEDIEFYAHQDPEAMVAITSDTLNHWADVAMDLEERVNNLRKDCERLRRELDEATGVIR